MGPGYGLICTAYDSTSDNSTLQKLVLSWHLQFITEKDNELAQWYESNAGDLPIGFYKRMMIGIARLNAQGVTAPALENAEKCTFHEHDEEVPACK